MCVCIYECVCVCIYMSVCIYECMSTYHSSQNCSLTFKSYTGFKYHISRCIQVRWVSVKYKMIQSFITLQNKILTCSLCNKRLTTLQRFQNHMKKIHNIEKEVSPWSLLISFTHHSYCSLVWTMSTPEHLIMMKMRRMMRRRMMRRNKSYKLLIAIIAA